MASAPTSVADNPTQAGLTTTKLLSDSGKILRRSVETPEQAATIIKTLIFENALRNQKNSRIMALYNSEQPVDPKKLADAGLAWKSNFSTKPLPQLVDKASSRFPKAINAARYLTSSRLPESIPGAKAKSEKFQRRVTELVRANPRWKNLINENSQETVMFGYAGMIWMDEYQWFPTFARQDKFYIPTGTKQSAADAPLMVFIQDNRVHEAFEKCQEAQAATSAGDGRWNMENLTNAINTAIPTNIRSGASEQLRVYEDLLREVSLSTSFTGAQMVRFYHLFTTEPSGRVTHQIYDGQYKPLFYHPERFERMTHVVAFFSHEQADGTMHGSKGLGRQVYNLARVLDRARNEVIDRLHLAGKLIIQGEERLLSRMKMHVVGNAIMIDSAYKIQELKLDPSVSPFFTLDEYLRDLLDSIGGSTSPKQLKGERVTNDQVNLVAGREDERADTFLERHLGQHGDVMSEIQRRLTLADTMDAEALEFQRALREEDGLSPGEIRLLGESPALSAVKDLTEVERAGVVEVTTNARGNPLYNAREVERQYVTAKTSAQFAETILLPQDDPTDLAEQTRLQMLELSLLLIGQLVPVSPRDNHLVHLSVAAPAIAAAAQQAAADPKADAILEALLTHLSAHVQEAHKAGVNKDALKPYDATVAAGQKTMAQLKAAEAQNQQQQQGAPGQPPASGPQPSAVQSQAPLAAPQA